MNEKRQATRVQDRPAERGITMTNVLLGFVLMLSGGFGTMFLYNFEKINETTTTMSISMKEMNDSITEIKVHDAQSEARYEYITMEIGENRAMIQQHAGNPEAHHWKK